MKLGLQVPPLADFGAILRAALLAEDAGFAFLWLPDRAPAGPAGNGSAASLDASLLASALAAQTSRIGLLVSAAPARHEPYNLARRLASLDWISHGRIGWMVDAGADTAREEEYVRLVRDLWDSWDDEAFIHDKAAGRFFVPEKMHVLDHRGPHFSVRGPLNVNRPPQGHPVIAAMAESGIAELADLVIEQRTGTVSKDRGVPVRFGIHEVAHDASSQLSRQLGAAANAFDGLVLKPLGEDDVAALIERLAEVLRETGLQDDTWDSQTLRQRLGLPRPALPKLEALA